MTQVRISAIALATVDGMVAENYSRALRMAEIAAGEKPDIILLPEAFAAGYCGGELREVAEPPDSPRLERFREFSGTSGCMVVLGYLEQTGQRQVRNAVVVFDCGRRVGTHYKSSLWPDDRRPYRNECALMLPGPGVDVIPTRLGKIGLLICYENTFQSNWQAFLPDVDLILSPYNCEGDPARFNLKGSKLIGKPSAWADRTGTVFKGDGYMPNLGTAGILDATGAEIAHSTPGVEAFVFGTVRVGTES